MKCHRCGDPMTMYVIGDDYCAACRRDIKAREDAERRRGQFKVLYRTARNKELPLTPVA